MAPTCVSQQPPHSLAPEPQLPFASGGGVEEADNCPLVLKQWEPGALSMGNTSVCTLSHNIEAPFLLLFAFYCMRTLLVGRQASRG